MEQIFKAIEEKLKRQEDDIFLLDRKVKRLQEENAKLTEALDKANAIIDSMDGTNYGEGC
jgi:FtsZ-binding cell division protein ZapB